MLGVLVLLSAVAGCALAQRTPISLQASWDDRRVSLLIKRVEAAVSINGDLADTRLTLTFLNPYRKGLEGDFHFPLPRGATVSAYAVEVEGRLRDGVIVERERARKLFEKHYVERDPGLAEWVAGRHFRTRVLEIPSCGTRRVMVRYVHRIEAIAGEFVYRLPLRFSTEVPDVSCRVEVFGPPAPPRVIGDGLGMAFTGDDGRFVAACQVAELPVGSDREIVVGVPRPPGESVAIVEQDGEDTLFMLRHTPRERARGPTATRCRRMLVLWDASGSLVGVERGAALTLLERWIQASAADPAEVALIVFRDGPEAPRHFGVAHGQCPDLLATLEAIPYDGATDLAAAFAAANTVQADRALIFTDGTQTLGAQTLPELNAPTSVLAYTAVADAALLSGIAHESGGRFCDLTHQEVAQALAALTAPMTVCRAVEAEGAEVLQVFPACGASVSDGVTVFGRLTADRATVRLCYGDEGSGVPPVEAVVHGGGARPGRLLSRHRGQFALQRLCLRPEPNRDAIVALGKELGLVTPFTSFIVFEKLRQYLRYSIEPPATLPDLRRDYLRSRAERARKREQTSDELAKAWSRLVSWWEESHPHRDGFVYRMDLRFPPEEQDVPASGPTGANKESGPMQTWAFTLEAGILGQREGRGRRVALGDGVGSEVEGAGAPSGPAAFVKRWDPNAPYLSALAAAPPPDRYATYLKWRRTYRLSPTFFLECADVLLAGGQTEIGVRVLSNVAELRVDDPVYLHRMARQLEAHGLRAKALGLLEHIAAVAPEKPAAMRELALMRERAGDYASAIDLLKEAIGPSRYRGYAWGRDRWWSSRSDGRDLIVLTEINHAIRSARQDGWTQFPIATDLISPAEFDLRLVVFQGTPERSVEVSVVEPSGEKASRRHERTTIGGTLVDAAVVTEYTLPRAAPGTYTVVLDYSGACGLDEEEAPPHPCPEPDVCFIDIYRDYGRPTEKHRVVRVPLINASGEVTAAEVRL